MNILVFDEKVIDAAIKRARKRPLPLKQSLEVQMADKRVLKLADRPKGFTERRPRPQVVMLGDYRANVSYEEQPAGLVRHLSISTNKPGTVPGIEVSLLIASKFGFTKELAHSVMTWLEEFEPGHYAINIAGLVNGDSRNT